MYRLIAAAVCFNCSFMRHVEQLPMYGVHLYEVKVRFVTFYIRNTLTNLLAYLLTLFSVGDAFSVDQSKPVSIMPYVASESDALLSVTMKQGPDLQRIL